MKEAIFDFVAFLRKSGIRVSLSELTDCFGGLEYIDLPDKQQFKSLLKGTLISRSENIPQFEKLFFLYFEKHQYAIQNNIPDNIADIIKNTEGFSDLFKKFITEGIEEIIPYIFDEKKHNAMSFYNAYRTRSAIEKDDWHAQLDQLGNLLKAGGMPVSDAENLSSLADKKMSHMNSLIQDFIESEKQINDVRNMQRYGIKGGTLLNRDFRSLGAVEIESIRQIISGLIKKIKDDYALRQRKLRHGKIDIKQTLRKSLQYGGLPAEIIWKRRKKSKGRIIALCDISNSVRSASAFMLSLLYSLQDQFDKVRSFVFVDAPVEITQFFEQFEIDEAISRSIDHAGITFYGGTCYGEVLRQFHEKYIDAVSSRTTVIVMGDARNNFYYSNEWALEKIRAKAKRVFWLNPESKNTWGSGDSEVYKYIKHCDDMRECRTLAQLAEFIDKAVL